MQLRKVDCIKPFHLAAYLLDPKAQGFGLNGNEDLEAISLIEQMAERFHLSVISDVAIIKQDMVFGGTDFYGKK